jgi:uncharacterized protein with GYD domain
MSKYAVFFTFRPEAIKALMATPSDRAAVVRSLCESAGGSMESYYLMLGSRYDGFTVVDLPDSASVASIHLESHELVESGDLGAILAKASSLTYTAPGS